MNEREDFTLGAELEQHNALIYNDIIKACGVRANRFELSTCWYRGWVALPVLCALQLAFSRANWLSGLSIRISPPIPKARASRGQQKDDG